jgi:hypothetical protein
LEEVEVDPVLYLEEMEVVMKPTMELKLSKLKEEEELQ